MTTRMSVGFVALMLLTEAPAAGASSLLRKLLRIAGLTAAPTTLRAPSSEASGEIWSVDVAGGESQRLTATAGFRSPVFAPQGTIYALENDSLIRLATGREVVVAAAPGVLKLVGFDTQNSGEVVMLLTAESNASPLAVLSLRTGRRSTLPIDAGSDDERLMLAQIRDNTRTYGDIRLSTRTESRDGVTRKIEWTDVYFQRGSTSAVNVSNCAGRRCSQPALSPDGHRVVFVKALP